MTRLTCHSRNMLISPHCNPTNPDCVDVLTTAYHTLLSSTLSTFFPKPSLTPVMFVDFVRSVLTNLPSSSHASPQSNPRSTVFGEHLVDMVWSLDAELDEIISDAKAAISNISSDQEKSKGAAEALAKSQKAKMSAEGDKETVQAIVKSLLVRCVVLQNRGIPKSGLPGFQSNRSSDLSGTSGFCNTCRGWTYIGQGLSGQERDQNQDRVIVSWWLFSVLVAQLSKLPSYKQNKFNLLREQSEGYSKLIVELTSNLGPPHSSLTARPVESWKLIEERVRPVWERVISLIGYFDLDPNRALDIILDVLSTHLATHYTFFLTLLSFSPWRGSYNRPMSEDKSTVLPVGSFKGKSLDEVLSLSDRQPTTPHPSTSRVLAQVLGFKFSYYAVRCNVRNANFI